MERATRYGSCVPATTIGIAPILIRDQWATHPPFTRKRTTIGFPTPLARPRLDRVMVEVIAWVRNTDDHSRPGRASSKSAYAAEGGSKVRAFEQTRNPSPSPFNLTKDGGLRLRLSAPTKWQIVLDLGPDFCYRTRTLLAEGRT